MTLAELTALMSRVGLRKPELMRDRNVALFIQECIDEARRPKADRDQTEDCVGSRSSVR